MKRILLLLLSAGLAFGQSCKDVTAGWDWYNGSHFNGFKWFPSSKMWQKIDTNPVAANNASWFSDWQAGGAYLWIGPGVRSGSSWLAQEGNQYNIELHVVDKNQPKVNVLCGGLAPDGCYEHDPSDVPIPVPFNPRVQHKCDAPGQGCPKYNSSGDKHVVVFDKDSCVYYELWSTYLDSQGRLNASSISIFDALGGDLQRPYSWTSGSAAGIPWFMGALRWEEVASGHIDHAIVMTGLGPGGAYHSLYADASWASHTQGSGAGTVPFGARMRLKSSFDINAYTSSTQLRTILKAMKEYGVYLVDGGGPDIIIEQSENWNYAETNKITTEWGLFTPTNFEIVEPEGPVVKYVGFGTAWPTGSGPTINSFTANGTAGNISITKGQTVTLAWTATGNSSGLYLVSRVGAVRGNSVKVTPITTTTYKVYATNKFAQVASTPITVTVTP